jgi:arylformamidase
VSEFTGEINVRSLAGVEIQASRILFKTRSLLNPDQWQNDFCYLAPELIEWLAARNVQLIGIDTPSMDQAQSKTLVGHQMFYSHGLSILEGLVLDEVPAGIYYLVALPLKIKSGEASPVRAILLDQNNLDVF